MKLDVAPVGLKRSDFGKALASLKPVNAGLFSALAAGFFSSSFYPVLGLLSVAKLANSPPPTWVFGAGSAAFFSVSLPAGAANKIEGFFSVKLPVLGGISLDVVASPPKKLAPPVEGLVSATLAEELSNPPVESEVVAPPKILFSFSSWPGYCCCCCFVSNIDEVPVAKAGMFAVEVNKDGAVVAGPFASPKPLGALVEVAFCANAVEGCKVEGCFWGASEEKLDGADVTMGLAG